MGEGRWGPVSLGGPSDRVRLVDGVRRADTTLTAVTDLGPTAGIPVVLGSAAAGEVLIRRGQHARFGRVHIDRIAAAPVDVGPFVTDTLTWRPVVTDDPAAALQTAMRELEQTVADTAGELTIVDGTVQGSVSQAVGLVKTHQLRYLPDGPHQLVADLPDGYRTPAFGVALSDGSRGRVCCYMRLRGGRRAGPWGGVVRLETPAGSDVNVAVGRVATAAATIAPFASDPWRDPRAPQNLVPVGALEKHLRRLLGPPLLIDRHVRAALISP